MFGLAGVMELADMPDLGSGERSCRFKSCHPHQVLRLFMRFHEESLIIKALKMEVSFFEKLQSE